MKSTYRYKIKSDHTKKNLHAKYFLTKKNVKRKKIPDEKLNEMLKTKICRQNTVQKNIARQKVVLTAFHSMKSMHELLPRRNTRPRN